MYLLSPGCGYSQDRGRQPNFCQQVHDINSPGSSCAMYRAWIVCLSRCPTTCTVIGTRPRTFNLIWLANPNDGGGEAQLLLLGPHASHASFPSTDDWSVYCILGWAGGLNAYYHTRCSSYPIHIRFVGRYLVNYRNGGVYRILGPPGCFLESSLTILDRFLRLS